MNNETYLYHHGVKGMKWGHRKQRVLKGRSSNRAQKKALKKQRKAGRKEILEAYRDSSPDRKNASMLRMIAESAGMDVETTKKKAKIAAAGTAASAAILAGMGGMVLAEGAKKTGSVGAAFKMLKKNTKQAMKYANQATR